MTFDLWFSFLVFIRSLGYTMQPHTMQHANYYLVARYHRGNQMSHRSETITVVLESPPAPGAPQLKVLGPRDLASRSLCSNCQATDADLRPDKARLALII